MKQKGAAELGEHIWKFDHKNTCFGLCTPEPRTKRILLPLAMALPPLFFSSGEGRTQPGLCPSVLCPFPSLTPQVPPPACSTSPLPRLPALGCHGAVQTQVTSVFP